MDEPFTHVAAETVFSASVMAILTEHLHRQDPLPLDTVLALCRVLELDLVQVMKEAEQRLANVADRLQHMDPNQIVGLNDLLGLVRA